MLDRLEGVLRRYEQIRANKHKQPSLAAAETLGRWLEDHVCPVAAQLLERPDFCQLARWPIDHLDQGADTEARHLVQEIDNELVDSAQRLAGVTRQPALHRALTEVASREGPSSAEQPPDDDVQSRRGRKGRFARKTVAEFVATRPWRDLVCIYDYFGPVADLNLENREAWYGPKSSHVQSAEFSPFCHPHLKLPGDYVVRSLMIRIAHWRRHLQQLATTCERTLRGQREDVEVHVAAPNIQDQLQRLEAICLQDPRSPLRQACMSLVQVCAAYRPQTNYVWLGRVGKMAGAAANIRFFVEQHGDTEITDHVAAAVSEVAALYRSELDPDDVIREQRRKVPLVLVDGRPRRELHWRGKLVAVDWEKWARAWTLMVALAEDAKLGQGADAFRGLGISLKDAKHDLKELLPPDLFKLINAKNRVYRLTLPPEDIFAARFEEVDRLTEVTPRRFSI